MRTTMSGAKSTTRSLARNRKAEGRKGRRHGTDGSHRHPLETAPESTSDLHSTTTKLARIVYNVFILA